MALLKIEFILLKYNHTLQVVRWMEKLAKRLHLTDEEIELAKIIGLLHDIGRFRQIESIHSFDDKKIDHAKIGYEYLFLEHHIRDFVKTEKYDEIIKQAILNHNTFKIDKKLDSISRKFTYMIRDMDKLDIFRVDSVYFNMEFIKEEISKDVLQDFKKHTLINRKKQKLKSDIVIVHLAFLFDIHFQESLELLDESDNLELFISTLHISKYSEDFANQIFNEVRIYLKDKLEQ